MKLKLSNLITRNNAGICIVLLLLIAGCASGSYERINSTTSTIPVIPADINLIEYSYSAADQLISNLQKNVNNKFDPIVDSDLILVASFVNINHMESSSTIGRTLAEQVGSRFAQKGYAVMELKVRKNIFLKEGSGEFVLSREIEKISKKHQASAVIVGTYAEISQYLYVTAKITAPDGRIYSSHDFRIPLKPLYNH